MTSAPRRRQASRPAMKPAASPFLRVKRTMWSAPWARATSEVASVEPSSMTSTSTLSMPSIWRGMAARVPGSVFSSFRQGIWTMSFMRAGGGRARRARETLAQGVWPWLARAPALHQPTPGRIEAELGHVVEDGGGGFGAPRLQHVGGGGRRLGHGQGGGDEAEMIVHHGRGGQRTHPLREHEQHALPRVLGAELEGR